MIVTPFWELIRIRRLMLRRLRRPCDRPPFRINPESMPVPYQAMFGQQFFHLLQPRLLGCGEFQIFRHWHTPHKQTAIRDARQRSLIA